MSLLVFLKRKFFKYASAYLKNLRSPFNAQCSETSDTLSPISVVEMTVRTQYNLGDAELLSGIIYAIVVSAENRAGVGPASNVNLLRKQDGSKSQ